MTKNNMSNLVLREQRLPDLNNTPDARTVFSYESEVRFDIEVARTSVAARKRAGKFAAQVSWSSRHGLSLEEAEAFATNLLAGIKKAQEDVVLRNATTPTTRMNER